jgi:Uma2 family endonuclease
MIAVESLQPENKVLTSILHTLAEEGYVAIEGEDEEMSETTLHYELINYLFNALKLFLKSRQDVFVASNLRISYDSNHPLKWYAPDVLIAFGIENRERSSYDLKEEKTMPQVIFEIASAQTAGKDAGDKYLDYARLGVEEYYLLDPERSLLPKHLAAYQLQNGVLLPVAVADNRIFSSRLGLEIIDTGDDFRLFNPATNEYLRSPKEIAESEAALARRVAELEALLKQNSK